MADLDAIGGEPAQLDLLARLQSAQGFGGPLLLDAGIASLSGLERLGGAFGHVVVGLETLSSFADLARLAAQVDVTFSLDLRNDLPLTRPELLVEEGPADALVLARAAVEAGARSLADEIDHKVLLPTQNPKLAYRTEGDMLHVDYFGKPNYVFPASDCALLPIQNSTAEMLAQFLALRLRAELEKEGYTHLTLLELEVEENFGQSATYRTSLAAD